MPLSLSTSQIPSDAVELRFNAFAGADVYQFRAAVSYERPFGISIHNLRLLWRGGEVALNFLSLKEAKQDAISDAAFCAWRRECTLFG